MKKLLSFMLCGTLVFTSCFTAFANSTTDDNIYINNYTIEELVGNPVDTETQMNIMDTISYLGGIGIETERLQNIDVNDDSIAYTYLLENDIESIIDVNIATNGDMIFNVTEDNKTDQIIISSNGDVYSDGVEIEISETETDVQIGRGDLLRSISYNSETCPKGKASDYNVSAGSSNNKNVALSKKLESYTINGLAILLAGISGTAFLAGISFYVASELIGELDGNTYGLSFKAKIYDHKDGISMGTAYKKYVTTWYSEKNYGGTTTNVTTYRITEYN